MKKIICYSVLTTMAVGTVAYGYCHYKNKQLEENEENEKNEEDDGSEKKKRKKKKEKKRKSKKENIIEEIQNITCEIKENIIAGLSCTTDLYEEMYNSMNIYSNERIPLCVEL